MATPPVLDVAGLLEPILGENPAGRKVRYEGDYDRINEARRADDDIPVGEWQRKEIKTSQWDDVVSLCTKCLKEKSKDLFVAVWLTEALTILHGYAGLREGLSVVHGIQERFWEGYYPEIEDGDLEPRTAPFGFMNGLQQLPLVVQRVAITDASDAEPLNFLSRDLAKRNDQEVLKAATKGTKISPDSLLTSKKFDEMVVKTPDSFYLTLGADVRDCQEVLAALTKSTDERFAGDPPSLLNLEQTVSACALFVETVLSQRGLKLPPKVKAAAGSEEGTDEAAAATEKTTENPATERSASSSISVPSGPVAADVGRLIIEFHESAQKLAELGVKLKENRQRQAELTAELNQVEQQYKEMSRAVSQAEEFYQLLARMLEVQGKRLRG